MRWGRLFGELALFEPKKTQAGNPEFLPVPACASFNSLADYWFGAASGVAAGVVAAAVVLAAGVVAALYRESRG